MKKTLQDYIEFLEQNNFQKEADYYRTELVDTLKLLGLTKKQILSMPTEYIMAILYKTVDVANELENKNQNWEYEFKNEP